MERNDMIYLLGILLVLMFMLSFFSGSFENKTKQTVTEQTVTEEKIRVELPFCKNVNECESFLKEKGFTDEQIKEANIVCEGVKCWGEAKWIKG